MGAPAKFMVRDGAALALFQRVAERDLKSSSHPNEIEQNAS
jgi:hypothetical protein